MRLYILVLVSHAKEVEMGIVSFLFGKKPLVKFTKDGRVKHDLKDSKWQEWKNRFEANDHYDFKKHSGTQPQPKK